MGKIGTCVLALVVASGAMASIVEPQNAVSFTPAGGTASFQIGPTDQWFNQAWAYNSDYQLWYGQDVVNGVDGAYAGLVYKFNSTTDEPMTLNIQADYNFQYWAGRKITLYYSDVNDWSQLSPMTGSRWGGWGEEFETNPNWTQLDSFAQWSGTVFSSLNGTNISTTDGEFYVRVDLSSASAPNGEVTHLSGLSWDGTVVPEPATVVILSLLGLGCLGRRKSR